MASDAFVACRGTRWLVRSLYFPVFLQIRNLPSRSHDLKHTHTSILPAAHSCARVLQLCFTHPKSRGGRSAEKRSGACEAPVGRALGASQDARERAYDAAGQALARTFSRSWWRSLVNIGPPSEAKAKRERSQNSHPGLTETDSGDSKGAGPSLVGPPVTSRRRSRVGGFRLLDTGHGRGRRCRSTVI
jgi:hypothetical protein